jgi:AcrR family transcriptional regulator
LISYHFGGKKGLLEQIMVKFYEGYFLSIKKGEANLGELFNEATTADRLVHVMKFIFDYLFECHQMTRFIYRELTIDSTLVREVMTLYLSQEKYYYLSIIEEGIKRGELKEMDLEIWVLQLLNVLYMPFLQPQVIREVHYIEPLSEEFKERYFAQIKHWILNSF